MNKKIIIDENGFLIEGDLNESDLKKLTKVCVEILERLENQVKIQKLVLKYLRSDSLIKEFPKSKEPIKEFYELIHDNILEDNEKIKLLKKEASSIQDKLLLLEIEKKNRG